MSERLLKQKQLPAINGGFILLMHPDGRNVIWWGNEATHFEIIESMIKKYVAPQRHNPTTMLGQRIRDLREQKGLTTGQVIGQDTATLRNIERGKTKRPHQYVIRRIAAGLGVSFEELWSLRPASKKAQLVKHRSWA
jgi:DNA-binding XRE family transcriptional regulator